MSHPLNPHHLFDREPGLDALDAQRVRAQLRAYEQARGGRDLLRPAGALVDPELIEIASGTYTAAALPTSDLSGAASLIAVCDVASVATAYIYLILPEAISVPAGKFLTLITRNRSRLKGTWTMAGAGGAIGPTLSLNYNWSVEAVTNLAGLVAATLNWNNQGTLAIDPNISQGGLTGHSVAGTIVWATGKTLILGHTGDAVETNFELYWENPTASAVDVVALRIGATGLSIGSAEPFVLDLLQFYMVKSTSKAGAAIRGWVIKPPARLTSP